MTKKLSFSSHSFFLSFLFFSFIFSLFFLPFCKAVAIEKKDREELTIEVSGMESIEGGMLPHSDDLVEFVCESQ